MVNKPQESLFCCEKLTIAQLLEELNVDRIEIASARKRRGISRSKRDNALEHQRIRNRIEVLTL
jgi:isopropylmalate/homocitrate/citramalate synthase